ncbi:efflux transporter outer membrane subunit [Stenotrophomonas maltophilia]|uniref:efflux transporter outer membrane subunit n=1 Tax=Stenotrophomonas maltophilia TaxID=40324 RepID=UPI0012AF7680|nr:efflux transporter outer membrane subunit [Stenotrophomonas maltophilia]QGM05639.1 efflux transporter outer membrane subunit [Stenotrophomonas maltophilia]
MAYRTATSKRLGRLPALLLLASASGCTLGPDFVRPDDGLATVQLSARGDYDTDGRTTSESTPVRWWDLFNDPVLTSLQADAQATNLDLLLAAERIQESRAQLGIASSDLLPSVGGSAAYAREANSANGKFAALGAPTSASDFWQTGLDASWEIDLWGRARRAREGAEATLEASIYGREVARAALAAEVARNYLMLRGTQSQLDVTRQNLEVADRSLSIAENRQRNGVGTAFETASARAQLATTRSLVPELTQRRNALVNALALLLGQEPRALDARLMMAMPLPVLPSNIPVGVPSELARRRPDIRRAEAQLHAATAAIGVAKADFYPRIGLRGRIGVEAFEGRDLGSWDSRTFSVGPTVYLPIFQGGRLKQRLALNESRQRSAAISYRQTVLSAWHEVDDALDGWSAQRAHHEDAEVAYEENLLALHAAERGYREGATDYLSVLTAQRGLLASQSALNTSATNSALAVVRLFKSLGGGWDSTAFARADEAGGRPARGHEGGSGP